MISQFITLHFDKHDIEDDKFVNHLRKTVKNGLLIGSNSYILAKNIKQLTKYISDDINFTKDSIIRIKELISLADSHKERIYQIKRDFDDTRGNNFLFHF